MMKWIEISSFVVVIAVGIFFTIGCGESPTDNEPDPEPTTLGQVQGTVVDATTGAPIEGATVTVGGIYTDTASDGAYLLSHVPSGAGVAAQAVAAGYVTLALTIAVQADAIVNQDFQLVPETGADIYRFVLTWSLEPRDLDSHLWTDPAGGYSYHVYYGYRGTLDALPFAQLDLDDTNGSGPETITIGPHYDDPHPGDYIYAVHEYAGDGTLAVSEAVVRVYASDVLVQTLHVPTGTCSDGWYWYVGRINVDSGQWTPVNTLQATPPVAYARDEAGK